MSIYFDFCRFRKTTCFKYCDAVSEKTVREKVHFLFLLHLVWSEDKI